MSPGIFYRRGRSLETSCLVVRGNVRIDHTLEGVDRWEFQSEEAVVAAAQSLDDVSGKVEIRPDDSGNIIDNDKEVPTYKSRVENVVYAARQ